MKTTISDLSWDLLGEVFSRVPLTYLSAVRSTCKRWNDLSKRQILGEKAAMKQFLAFMIVDYSTIRSLRFELQGIRNDDYDYQADPPMKKLSIPNQVKIHQVFHCDGLLLCVTSDPSKLLVWNPYLAQTRLIQSSSKFHITSHRYVLGYDEDNNNNKRNHKILRLPDSYRNYEVYDFSSDSWRALDVKPSVFHIFETTVSLKGNTYFCGETEESEGYLLCFEFTTERFGPRLPLPPQPYELAFETVTLSVVTDEKLALLYDREDAYSKINIWTTTKIEPNAVSWNKFLTLDRENGLPGRYMVGNDVQSFFIDEEKKVAVFFYAGPWMCRYHMAYIIGEDGYFRYVNMGEEACMTPLRHFCTLKCSSYVPSLVKLQI